MVAALVPFFRDGHRPGSPSPVGRGAGIGGRPSPATPWLKDLGSSNLPPGVQLFRRRDRLTPSGNYPGRFGRRCVAMLMGCEECRVDRKLSDETASISLVDLRRARDGLRLRGGGEPVWVDKGLLLGSLGPGEPVRPQRHDRVGPIHVHTVDRNRESVPPSCGDELYDSPRRWNRILRLVDDSFGLGQLGPKSSVRVQLVRWDSASFAFKAWIGFRTSGSTRRSTARYRLT